MKTFDTHKTRSNLDFQSKVPILFDSIALILQNIISITRIRIEVNVTTELN